MKRCSWILFGLILIAFISCKKETEYKSEIFLDKYRVIYGNWQYRYSVDENGGTVLKENHTIEFIPIGKFSYNGGVTGQIGIVRQDTDNLIIDFGSLFPNVSWASIAFSATGDTMNFAVVNGLSSLYVKIP